MSMKKALLCVTELRIEIKATQIISLMSGLSWFFNSALCWMLKPANVQEQQQQAPGNIIIFK